MAGTLQKVPPLARLPRQYPTEAACPTRSGRKRRIVTTIPLSDVLSGLLKPAIGRQIRRTANYGLSVLANFFPGTGRLS